tara:strand:- start:1268 stop:2362 length:1095 start_codon:yes stop_codon:yes gene_type:complete
MKKAFITGVCGQDGSYLTELLLEKNYEVHAIIRRSSIFNTHRIDHLRRNENFFQYYGDLTDSSNLNRLLKTIKPTEIYNLAAQSHVGVSFDVPEYTADVAGLGTLRLLEVIRDSNLDCKFYQAGSSEMFGGKIDTIPQNENTKFTPRSPYGVAKLYSHWITVNYREAYDLFACNGILFNHESPRRGENFVTRKITRAVAAIIFGKQEFLELGNLDAKRDWGHAKEYVKAQWMMLQQEQPDDYVIATGKCYSIREFAIKAFEYVGIEIVWKGNGLNEVGIDKKTNKTLIKINKNFYRPTEVDLLLGDATKAKEKLGWKPRYTIDDLIAEMMEYDLYIEDNIKSVNLNNFGAIQENINYKQAIHVS